MGSRLVCLMYGVSDGSQVRAKATPVRMALQAGHCADRPLYISTMLPFFSASGVGLFVNPLSKSLQTMALCQTSIKIQSVTVAKQTQAFQQAG